MKEQREALKRIASIADPMKEQREALKRIASIADPMKEQREALKRIASLPDPLREQREALKRIASIADPMREQREALKRIASITNPMKEQREALKRITSLPDPLKDQREAIERLLSPFRELVPGIESRLQSAGIVRDDVRDMAIALSLSNQSNSDVEYSQALEEMSGTALAEYVENLATRLASGVEQLKGKRIHWQFCIVLLALHYGLPPALCVVVANAWFVLWDALIAENDD